MTNIQYLSEPRQAPRIATLQDVANRAGVHRSTVALALRDHPRLPVATRGRIQAIAEQLGYRINPLVAALMQSRRTGRSTQRGTLAFVSNHPTRYGWQPLHHDRPDFFPGAKERANDFGYTLEHFWLAEPGMTPRRFSDILTARGVHGLIVGRLPLTQSTLGLAWDRFSAVALGMTLCSPLLHHVTENHFDTAWLVMRECRKRGYRRVGFVFAEINDSPRVNDRWLGAYFQQQLEYPPEDRLPVCPGGPPDVGAFREWFRRERPDALLVTNVRAIGIVDWLAALGKRVPEDVGMVELQNNPAHGICGVSYAPSRIGALSVEMLVGLINRNETGVPGEPLEVQLTGEWREAGTLPPRNK